MLAGYKPLRRFTFRPLNVCSADRPSGNGLLLNEHVGQALRQLAVTCKAASQASAAGTAGEEQEHSAGSAGLVGGEQMRAADIARAEQDSVAQASAANVGEYPWAAPQEDGSAAAGIGILASLALPHAGSHAQDERARQLQQQQRPWAGRPPHKVVLDIVLEAELATPGETRNI